MATLASIGVGASRTLVPGSVTSSPDPEIHVTTTSVQSGSNNQGIAVKCVRCLGQCEAPSISDSLITTTEIAVMRGTRFLDDPGQGGYYLCKEVALTVPHKQLVEPGDWVTFFDYSGNTMKKFKVLSYSFSITKDSVMASVNCRRYVDMCGVL